jgi:ankyrin repeat protein
MDDIWHAAMDGDVGEVERLIGQDPGLLDAGDEDGWTPLMFASAKGHVGVVRWLGDEGAAINERDLQEGGTGLFLACCQGHAPVVRLLLERGADPTIADTGNSTPLMIASGQGHLEVVRVLLGRPSGKATVNHRNVSGRTALWWACCQGRGGVVRALLESAADPTVAEIDGTTPTAVAKEVTEQGADTPEDRKISAEGRRECVAALEVRSQLCSLNPRL